MNESDLHPYQKACVEHAIKHPFCGLFLDMGLGKTVTTLTAIDKLMFDYFTVNKVLVVATKRIAETVWAEEAQNWDHLKELRFSKIVGDPKKRLEALAKNADVYVISRDNVVWLLQNYQKVYKHFPFDMGVADELSSFKSNKSKRFKAMKVIRSFMTRFIGLTGTPAPNGLIDLWPQIFLLDRGERLGKTLTAYRDTYFKPAIVVNSVVYSYALLPGSEERIRNKIGDICISMKAEDYLNMPARTDNIIPIEFPTSLRKQYKDFERKSVLELNDVVGDSARALALNAAGLANKLLQFCNGAVYGEDEVGNPTLMEIHTLKIDALREILESANGQPVLVATSYKFDETFIMRHLSEYHPRKLMSSKDIEEWNAGKIELMIAHPASAGHGLNLQRGGHIIVWYGLPWSLELYQQFNARLYRQGQTHPVIIHHLVITSTYDSSVMKTLRRKDATQAELMEGIKARIKEYINHEGDICSTR